MSGPLSCEDQSFGLSVHDARLLSISKAEFLFACNLVGIWLHRGWAADMFVSRGYDGLADARGDGVRPRRADDQVIRNAIGFYGREDDQVENLPFCFR